MQRHNYGLWLAWALLAATLLGAMLTAWGQFTALTERVNDMQTDVLDLAQRVDRLENCARLPQPCR